MSIIIGGAWPYANGSLHIGHIASLLPGDVIARYYRAKGEEVFYVSGSDCHGTPITIRAKKEGVTPDVIADRYHTEFANDFRRLGFTFDNYSQTTKKVHKEFVKEFITKLYENGSLYEKQVQQVYCEHCDKFLPDRYVLGKCPVCHNECRGDQCDFCGSILEPENLEDIRCAICNSKPVFKPSKQLYLNIKRLGKELNEYISSHDEWRANTKNISHRYVDEGLQDRAATRDLEWGIDVPIEGYEDKKIYVWVEAVLGYLSACKEVCDKKRYWFL